MPHIICFNGRPSHLELLLRPIYRFDLGVGEQSDLTPEDVEYCIDTKDLDGIIQASEIDVIMQDWEVGKALKYLMETGRILPCLGIHPESVVVIINWRPAARIGMLHTYLSNFMGKENSEATSDIQFVHIFPENLRGVGLKDFHHLNQGFLKADLPTEFLGTPIWKLPRQSVHPFYDWIGCGK